MAIEATLAERKYIGQAECESFDRMEKEISKPCPRCGKRLIISPMQNGARRIHCEDDNCIEVYFRGL